MSKKKKLTTKFADGITKFADGITSLVAGIGGANMVASDYHYVATQTSEDKERLRVIYDDSWIASRVIDTVAEDMTSRGINFPELQQEEVNKINKAIHWTEICDAVKDARLYGAVLVIIEVEGQNHATTFYPESSKYLKYKLLAVPQDKVSESNVDDDPEFYTYKNVRFHKSRCFKMIFRKPKSKAQKHHWGLSIFQRVYESLADYDATRANVRALVDQCRLRTISVDNLRGSIMTKQGEDELLKWFSQIALLQRNQGLTLIDTQDRLQTDYYNFQGLPQVLDGMTEVLCASVKIPKSILFGIQASGLNNSNEQDRNLYKETISSEQHNLLTPFLNWYLPIVQGLSGVKIPLDGWDFVAYETLSETAKLEMEKKKLDIFTAHAQTLIALQQAGIIIDDVVIAELKKNSAKTGYFDIDEETIEMLRTMPQELT